MSKADEVAGKLEADLLIWAAAADEGERISAAYATGKVDRETTSPMGDCIREAASLLRSQQERIKGLEEDKAFLHRQRGELVIERDRARGHGFTDQEVTQLACAIAQGSYNGWNAAARAAIEAFKEIASLLQKETP